MQLLKHFKELTVSPKNAKELKGLILQLAIQGKLTADWRKYNKDVEPASELLKKTIKKKEEIVRKKRKEKILPPLTNSEIPFGIAKSWVWTRLGEIGTTNVGLTYKPVHKNDSGVPVLRSSNIQEGELCLKDLVRVNTDYRDKDIIQEGDLLICARNGSRRLVGKCTIIGQIDEIMVFGAFMAIFRSGFNPYLQLFIQSPQYRSKLNGVETTTINQITQGNLKATVVPLPPLEEQKEIVKVVETLFKEVEQLEQLTVARISLKEKFVASALNQLTKNNTKQEWTFLQEHFKNFFNETTNIKKLRESILKLAVQGKLTADWRVNNTDTEDASILLKCIKEEKAQLLKDNKIKKEKILPLITEDEIPYELPKGWIWCRMQDLCPNISSGSTPPKPFFKDEGIPYLKVYNIRNQKINFDYRSQFVDEEYHSTKLKRSILRPGDIIMNIVGPPLGKVAIIPNDYPQWNCNQAISFFKPLKRELNIWIYTFLLAGDFLDRIELIGTAGQDNISVTKSKNIILPLPPLNEQKAIVQKVNDLMNLCDKLEQEVLQNQEYSSQLMQSCLREIFEGEHKTVEL